MLVVLVLLVLLVVLVVMVTVKMTQHKRIYTVCNGVVGVCPLGGAAAALL